MHRKTEALDAACLRALGHPHDHAVRQELLSALERDRSDHPDHALFCDCIARLRKSLGSLRHVLATRHDEPPKE